MSKKNRKADSAVTETDPKELNSLSTGFDPKDAGADVEDLGEENDSDSEDEDSEESGDAEETGPVSELVDWKVNANPQVEQEGVFMVPETDGSRSGSYHLAHHVEILPALHAHRADETAKDASKAPQDYISPKEDVADEIAKFIAPETVLDESGNPTKGELTIEKTPEQTEPEKEDKPANLTEPKTFDENVAPDAPSDEFVPFGSVAPEETITEKTGKSDEKASI